MLIFTESGLALLKDFTETLTNDKSLTNEQCNEACRNIKDALLGIAFQLLNQNDLQAVRAQSTFFYDQFDILDGKTKTFTPTIFNEQSKIIFIHYLEFLKRLYKDLSTYLVYATIAVMGGIDDLIQRMIKYMENQVNLYERRERSIKSNLLFNTLQERISNLFGTLHTKILDNQEITTEETNTIRQLYEAGRTLPMSHESNAVISCADASDYREKNNNSRTTLARTVIYAKLLDLEINLNQLLQQEDKNPQFTFVTSELQKRINPKATQAFNQTFTQNLLYLVAELTGYDEDKRPQEAQLKTRILTQIKNLIPDSPLRNCLDIRTHLQQALHEYLTSSMNSSHFDKSFEEIISKGLAAFSDLENKMTSSYDTQIAKKTMESLSVLENQRSTFSPH